MLFPTFSQWRTRFLIATFIETVRIWKWSRYDVKPAKQGRYTSGRADTSDLCSHVCNPGAPVIFVIDIHNVKNTHTFCLRSPDIALIFRLHENCTYSVYISILSPIHLLKKKNIYIYAYREWKFITTINTCRLDGSNRFEKSLTNFFPYLASSFAMMSHKPLCTCNSSSHRARIPMRRALLRHHTQSPPQSSIRPGRGSINYQGHPIGKSNCEGLDRK